MDGRRQRNALTAAESALRSLASGDHERARTDAAKAVRLDQIGAFERFGDALEAFIDHHTHGEPTGVEEWSSLTDSLPEGPLRAMAESLAP